MENERMLKGFALLALLGGVARVGMTPAALVWGTDSMPELIVGLTACLLMGIGIFGIHMGQAPRAGALGLLSVLLISVSSTLTAALVWSSMLGVTHETHDYVGTMQAVNSLTAIVGMLLFAIVTVRARVYPIAAIALYLLFPVASFIPGVTVYSTVFWGASYILFGYFALAGKRARSAADAGAAA